MKLRREKASRHKGNSMAAESSAPTITVCASCGEEVVQNDPPCVYCGTNLSTPLATTKKPRRTERRGSFSEDTPGSFISGAPNI